MFADLRLITRLAMGFLVPVLFIVITGMVSLYSLSNTHRGLETVYLDRVVPLRELKVIADKYAIEVIDAVNKCNAGMFSPAQALQGVVDSSRVIREQWQAYLQTELSAEELQLVEEAKQLFAAADADIERLTRRLAELGSSGEGLLAEFDGPLYDSIDPISSKITELIDLQLQIAREEYEAGAARYQTTRWAVLALIALCVVLASAVGYGLARSILRQLGGEPAYAAATVRQVADGDLEREVKVSSAGPCLLGDMRQMQAQLRRFIAAQKEMAARHGEGDIDFRVDTSQFPGAYGEMAGALNSVVDLHIRVNARVMELLSRYAIGELNQDMDPLPGKLAATTTAMVTAKHNLQSINADIQRLANSAAAGDFSARGNEQAYQYSFRDMVSSLNRLMLEAESGLRDVDIVLEALAVGDLSQRVERAYQGAFGRLAGNANTTVEQLGHIVGDLRRAAEAIHTASSEIAAGNADLSARTEQQAANLEETSASMEELTSIVRQNADNAQEANQLAMGASEVATRGGEVVTQVISTMDSINQSSHKIVDIISVIDGIAFQTNILALNAAVEAARAGEQGRGFAVVASEVRALAQRSAAAAKEIKALIDDSVGRVTDGTKLVHQAGHTMGEVVTAVRRVTSIMGEISAASAEQSAGILQVSETVTHMDDATQQNAALVEEATAAARAMEQQAENLANTVRTFRLSA